MVMASFGGFCLQKSITLRFDKSDFTEDGIQFFVGYFYINS